MIVAHIGIYDDESYAPERVAECFKMILTELIFIQPPIYRVYESINDKNEKYYLHDFTVVTNQPKNVVESVLSCDCYSGAWGYLYYDDNGDYWTTETTVGQHGSSLVANITAGCRLLGIDRGERITITIKRDVGE